MSGSNNVYCLFIFRHLMRKSYTVSQKIFLRLESKQMNKGET